MNYQLVMQMMCISCEGFAGAMPMVFKPGPPQCYSNLSFQHESSLFGERVREVLWWQQS